MWSLFKDILKIYAISAAFALIPSALSVFVWVATVSLDPPTLLKVLLWNFYLAREAARVGLLPTCGACELFIVVGAIVYSFIVGVLGYSFLIAPFLAYARLSKKDKLP